MNYRERAALKGGAVFVVAGIVLTAIAPRFVTVDPPLAEYRSVVTGSSHDQPISNADSSDLETGLLSLLARIALLISLIAFVLPFVVPRPVRREVRMFINRVRAPGSLFENDFSRAKGRTKWHWRSDIDLAASLGRRRNLGTIAV